MILRGLHETFEAMAALQTGEWLAVSQRARAMSLVAGAVVVLSCASGGVAVHQPTKRVSSGPPAAANTPPEQASAVPAPSPPAGPIADPCRAAQAFNAAAIAQAEVFAEGVMEQRLASGTYKGRKPTLPIDFELTSWLSCVKTPGGAWAIVLPKAVLTPRDDYDWGGAVGAERRRHARAHR